MSRATLESDMRDHPKWLVLTPLAYRLGVRLVLWAKRHSGGGFVPDAVVKEYAGTKIMGKKLAKELTDCGSRFGKAGILETCEGGFIVHDLLTEAEIEATAPVSATVHARPLTKSEAGRLGGQASVQARVAASGSASPKQTPVLRSSNPEASGSASAKQSQAGSDLTCQNDSGSSSKTPSSSNSERVGARAEPTPEAKPAASAARPKLWKKIPADWQPKDKHREICRERGVDFALETAKLRDHEFNPKREDADATAANWYRNARPTFQPSQRQPGLPDQPAPALTAEQAARVARRQAEMAELERKRAEELLGGANG